MCLGALPGELELRPTELDGVEHEDIERGVLGVIWKDI